MYQHYVDVVKDKKAQEKDNKTDKINEERAINQMMKNELEKIE